MGDSTTGTDSTAGNEAERCSVVGRAAATSLVRTGADLCTFAAVRTVVAVRAAGVGDAALLDTVSVPRAGAEGGSTSGDTTGSGDATGKGAAVGVGSAEAACCSCASEDRLADAAGGPL